MPSLIATMGLDATSFKANADRAVATAKGAGKQISSAFGSIKGMLGGVAAGFGFSSLISGLTSTALRMADLSDQFRISTDTLQRWEIGAERVGLRADDIASAFVKVKKAREAAITKGEPGAFAVFGMTLNELKTAAITTEEIMQAIASAAANRDLTDAEDVAAMEIMGRSGSQLLSALREIHKLGPVRVMSEQDIQAIDKLDQTLKDLKREAERQLAKGAPMATKFIKFSSATDRAWHAIWNKDETGFIDAGLDLGELAGLDVSKGRKTQAGYARVLAAQYPRGMGGQTEKQTQLLAETASGIKELVKQGTEKKAGGVVKYD